MSEKGKTSRSKITDYYKLLDINKDATKEQVQKAFMTQALLWHPDKAEDDEEREEFTKIYQDLQYAYRILSNDESRKMYADSQQNTYDTLKTQNRDTTYHQTDDFTKVTASGREFDTDSFLSSFNKTRDEKEQEALNALNDSVGKKPVTETDYQKLLSQRREQEESISTHNVFGSEKFDSNAFNHAFEFMKAKDESNALEEYHGTPLSMFSTGGLVEDDPLSGTNFNNGFSFSNTGNDLMKGISSNPDSSFDMSQFKDMGHYGSDVAMTADEMDSRIAAINGDRERLKVLKEDQFSTEPTEIEKMYSGLFQPVEIESIEAPTHESKQDHESESTDKSSKGEPVAGTNNLMKKIIKLKSKN